MASWKLKTPLGTIECHKGRSFGEKVWKKPDPSRIFKVAYFSEKGVPLDSDVWVHINNKWIPAKGNDKYHPRINWETWEEMGKPKSIDGRNLGVVVKKVGLDNKIVNSEVSLVWDATKELKIDKVKLHRFVSRDMKYIIPEREYISSYIKINKYLNEKGIILITKPVTISKNSSVNYIYAIIPIGTHLVYVELLSEDLEKPFPSDALIPSENEEEIDFEDEGDDLI